VGLPLGVLLCVCDWLGDDDGVWVRDAGVRAMDRIRLFDRSACKHDSNMMEKACHRSIQLDSTQSGKGHFHPKTPLSIICRSTHDDHDRPDSVHSDGVGIVKCCSRADPISRPNCMILAREKSHGTGGDVDASNELAVVFTL
jgi:hypothetical protein